MSIYDFDNYRNFLKSQLADKLLKNPNYSLRAMARQLGVANSTLSEVINGRANLSSTSARKIARGLKLGKNESNFLCDLVQFNSEMDPEVKDLLADRIRKFYPKARTSPDLNLEIFKQMSDWFHMTIMEIPLLTNPELSPSRVSKSLGIPVQLVEIAFSRLESLGIFERTEDGRYLRKVPELRVRSEIKNAAMKKYYKQMLEKIAPAIDEQTPTERLSGYLNIALDPEALPEIDQAIDHFFNEVKLIASKHHNKTKIYHLSLHFINMIKEDLKNEKSN